MNIPLEHFALLRDFSAGDPTAFNKLYNCLVSMYERKYMREQQAYTLQDASAGSLLKSLKLLQTHNLLNNLGGDIYLRPIMLPINNEICITPVISAGIFAMMLRTNGVIQSAMTKLVREGEKFSLSDNAITHTNFKPNNKVVGGYVKAILQNGESKITFISKARIDENTYRTDHLCYGGLIGPDSDIKVFNEAVFFAFLSDLSFSLASMKKTALLHKCNALIGIKANLYLRRQRMESQARFLQSAQSGSHDRVALKINLNLHETRPY